MAWPLVALGVSVLGSLFGKKSSGGSAAQVSPLQQYVMQEAFLRGLQRASGAPPQSFQLSADQKGQNATGQPTAGGSGLLTMTGPSTQSGGTSFPDAPGGGSKMMALQYLRGLQAPQNTVSAEPTTSDLYSAYLQRALSGNDVLPSGQLQGALATGLDVINRQAATGASGLTEALGARGLLHSGVLSRGLADVEGARLGQIGQLTQDMIARQLEAGRLSQQNAASLYAAAQRQSEAIEASQPTLWDRLAGLVGAGAQWYYGRPQ